MSAAQIAGVLGIACAGDVRAPPEFWGSEKGQSLISAYRSLVQQAPLDSKSYLRCFHSMYAGITKKNIFGTIFERLSSNFFAQK